MNKYAFLVMVEANNNNNKFYEMVEVDNNNFKSFNGRIDVSRVEQKTQPIHNWSKIYNSKIKKGYKDLTELKTVKTYSSSYKEIEDKKVKELIDDLNYYSKQTILDNYTVKTENVSIKQIDKAQEILNNINKNYSKISLEEINKNLVELYITIPRKMKKVQEHLLQNKDNFSLIKNEQDLLDTLTQQVQQVQGTDDNSEQKNILDLLGIKANYLDNLEKVKEIKNMCTGHFRDKIKNIFEITNITTQKEFDNCVVDKNISLLWHGSRNENWLSILKNGLIIRPTTAIHTGSLLGDAIYFADDIDKSGGYTSMSGSRWASGRDNKFYLALYEVNLGRQLILKHSKPSYSLDKNNLNKNGYDSVLAKAGMDTGWTKLRKDEFTIYDKNQCTIKYIIEFNN